MAKLTIKKDEKDPIVELLNQQAIEDFKAKRQQFQQTLPKRQDQSSPFYSPYDAAPQYGQFESNPYIESRPVASGMNAMREALMPYVRNMPWFYQPTDLPTNAMLLGAHPMASDAFRGPPEEPPQMLGYYGGTASYNYPMKLYGQK